MHQRDDSESSTPPWLLTEHCTVGNLHHEQLSQWVTALQKDATHTYTFTHILHIGIHTHACICIHIHREYVWSCDWDLKLRTKHWWKVNGSQTKNRAYLWDIYGLEYEDFPSQQYAQTYTQIHTEHSLCLFIQFIKLATVFFSESKICETDKSRY